MAYKNKDWPELEVQQLLASVADHFDLEDQAVRERQIRTWRQLKLTWANYTNIWYDEVAHDWRIYDYTQRAEVSDDQAYYDKSVNVFRAYLESIIAALSVTVPPLTCFPDDAQNNLDLQTAKAGDNIAKLLYRHNNVSYMWLHALYIYCTEGMIACYNYEKCSAKFGTYEEKQTKNETELKYLCPECQAELSNEMVQAAQQGMSPQDLPIMKNSDDLRAMEMGEFMPDDEDVALHSLMQENPAQIICPECAIQIDPGLQATPLTVEKIIGITKKAKSRVCMEVYGGLNVKIPNWARTQEEIPYLRYSYETHYANVVEEFQHLSKEFVGYTAASLAGETDPYENWGRLSPQYNGEYPINNTTVNHYWFRHAAFNVLPSEQADRLKKLYPDGCHYTKVQECFAGACNESLDDHWTLTHNPVADYLQHDPLGVMLLSIQDIISEIISLILQTMEHGITQGFADPSVLNFKKYRETEVRPGDIFPAVTKSGRNMSDFFHEIKTANLSPEVMSFYGMVQELGQLVSGALPSLFGGQMSGSKTASEYSMSRAQALQRLQTPWKMLMVWWKEIFSKAIPLYIKISVDDEKFVSKDTYGNFINTFIRKAELQGKIGSIEVEGDDNIPITWNQQKEVVERILQSGNQELMAILFAPENMPLLKASIGLPELEIPGENDRNKQFEEIMQLMDSEPIILPPDPNIIATVESGVAVDPAMLQQQEVPSIEVDPDLDNHQIEGQICRNWLIGEAGRLAKTDRPLGYKNVLLHYKMHLQLAQLQMQEQQAQAEGLPEDKAGGEKSGKSSKDENGSGMSPKKNEDSSGNRTTIQ